MEELIRAAMAYNIARPHEVFLGYVDGAFWPPAGSSRAPPSSGRRPGVHRTRRIHHQPVEGIYQYPGVGEVRYLAIPVTLRDPGRGVIVSAFFGDRERERRPGGG